MTALFINIKIDQEERFDIFKITLSEIESLFDECHIKIRGAFADQCIIFAKKLFEDRARFYQELQEKDWVAATAIMIENVKARSIFSYLEDHKLTTSLDNLNLVLKEFDEHQLDYLGYSFFRASQLELNNLLPLNPQHRKTFGEFLLNKKNKNLLKKISPFFYIYSCVSISSTYYFKKLLYDENKKFKIYLKYLSSILTIFFSYPKYRIIISFINFFLSIINLRLCFYSPSSPFNMEKMNLEITSINFNSLKKWKFGTLKNELFANYDDDNGAYGESLVKRGLYPFDIKQEVNLTQSNHTSFVLKLNTGDFYDCTYYSQKHRVRIIPTVLIRVNYGKLKINYNNKDIVLKKNDCRAFYTNLSPVINCIEDAEIILSIYDECFK